MSNGLLKKNKAHKIIKKVNVDLLYKRACESYGLPLSEKIKEDQYRPLLQLAVNMRVEQSMLLELLNYPGEIISGSIHTVFALPEVPQKIYRFSGHVSNFELKNCSAVFIPTGPNIKVLYMSTRMGRYEQLPPVSRKAEVCLIPHDNIELAYDMRKWPRELVSAYFESKFEHLPQVPVSDAARSAQILGLDLTKKNNLVQIRKINPAPSKPQMKKAELGAVKIKLKAPKNAKHLINPHEMEGLSQVAPKKKTKCGVSSAYKPFMVNKISNMEVGGYVSQWAVDEPLGAIAAELSLNAAVAAPLPVDTYVEVLDGDDEMLDEDEDM